MADLFFCSMSNVVGRPRVVHGPSVVPIEYEDEQKSRCFGQ
jgi:hypothetical protein